MQAELALISDAGSPEPTPPTQIESRVSVLPQRSDKYSAAVAASGSLAVLATSARLQDTAKTEELLQIAKLLDQDAAAACKRSQGLEAGRCP